MCIAGGVQERRVWTCVFGSLQVSSDEERRYSRFAGERRVVYHGLPGASSGEDRSRSRLRGSSSLSRRPQEERGHRRRDRSLERRRGPQARGRRPVGGEDERSRSRLGGRQEQWRRAGEERARPERTRGESPRRARSPRRRSPVRRERRRSPLRSVQSTVTVSWKERGSSGAKLDSRARAPSRTRGDSGRERRRSPELRRLTGRGRSPRRRVAQSQVRFRSPARGVAETRTLSKGEQENRAPEIPMEVRTVSVTAQEEAAPREPDGTRPTKPAGESGKDTELTQCTVCGEPRRCLKKHVHAIHLPWFWVPEKACWHCQASGSSQAHLQGKHWDVHEELGKFGSQQLSTWFLSITAVLEVVAEHFGVPWEKLGEVVQERGWIADLEPAQSVVRQVLWGQLVRYWGGTVTTATSSPCDLSAVLHWRTGMRMMAELPKERRTQVSGARLVQGPASKPTRALVVDGHCHLELLRQRSGMHATIESILPFFQQEHRSSYVEGLEAVVSNQVFRVEWEAHIPAIVGHVKVLRTWGAHPKALDDVDWSWLEGKMASPDCVAIGECGLDETSPNMARQEDAFKRQIEKARQLKKPLVLHLRGRNPSRTSAIYGQALALTSSILPRKHQVYLHSFSATQAEYKLWHRAFPNLLVGCSWLTASDINCWPMLRMMHTESLALETDSPHLAPRIGWINSPMRIWAQAEMVAEVRNVPVSTLLECSNRALRKFYSLWVQGGGLCF